MRSNIYGKLYVRQIEKRLKSEHMGKRIIRMVDIVKRVKWKWTDKVGRRMDKKVPEWYPRKRKKVIGRWVKEICWVAQSRDENLAIDSQL